jgi:hypothetical protein
MFKKVQETQWYSGYYDRNDSKGDDKTEDISVCLPPIGVLFTQ